ncbi:MAG: tetratricopeptide repeat protein [Trueperaceae bacterium]
MGVVEARTRSALAPALALLMALLLAFGNAQGFDETRYFNQCQLFEARGDLETARQFCLNALQVRPDFAEAELVLARIELGLGDPTSAETRLRRVRNRIDTAEPLVLLAQSALDLDRPGEAEGLLQEAQRRLASEANVELEARVAVLSGQIMQSQGRYDEALAQYARAIAIDPLNVSYRLLDANLRLRLRDADSAARQLSSYIQLTGNDRDPDVRSLLGRALWAQGDLSAASGHLATAHQLRGARNVEAQAADLRGLALISYAEGDFAGGGLALRESFRRENFTSALAGNTLLWVLLLLLVVALHLVGESRISASSSLEVIEGPQPWSVGQIYGTLITALLVAVLVTVLYGLITFENVLALLTPGAGGDATALFFLTFAVMLALLSWRRVQMNGHDAYEELLGDARTVPYGIGWGLLFLGLTIAYLYYRPGGEALGGFYVDFLQATPLVVAAAILIPLAELFFRPFVMAPLKKRYTAPIATALSGALYALAFGVPILLLLPFGLVLAAAWNRRSSGWEPLLAQLTLHVGLLVAVAASPWVRSLFY